MGFEPMNDGFANRCLGPLGYAAHEHQRLLENAAVEDAAARAIGPSAPGCCMLSASGCFPFTLRCDPPEDSVMKNVRKVKATHNPP